MEVLILSLGIFLGMLLGRLASRSDISRIPTGIELDDKDQFEETIREWLSD